MPGSLIKRETKHGATYRLEYYCNGIRGKVNLGYVTQEEAEEYQRNFNPTFPPVRVPVEKYDLRRMFYKSKQRAAERSIRYLLTFADIEAMWTRSNGRCEVTGIPFDLYAPQESQRRPWAPSVDRIDSRGDYTTENCRLVCGAVNVAMAEWGLPVLHAIARALVQGHPGTIEKPPIAGDVYRGRSNTKRQAMRTLRRKKLRINHGQDLLSA